MKLVRGWFPAAALVLGLAFSAQDARAQILYGGIVGNVTDATNAAVPGATVTTVSRETAATRTTITNEVGAFNFSTLATGTYEVSVSLDGFRTARRPGVLVPVNNTIRIDVAMELGEVTETVTVEATGVTLQTDRAEVRAQVTAENLQNLPIPPGRNYQSLLGTIPGFSPPRNAHSVPANPSRSLRFNVNGTSGSNNNTRIDGASSTNIWLPHMVGYIPALDSIETVDVVTNSFDAEQGLGRRRRDQRPDQERHERSARLGLLVSQQQQDKGAALFLAGGRAQPEERLQPIRRHGGRTDRGEQAVLLR